MTMTKRDDTSMAEQNAEIRRWAEANGLTVGAIFGEQRDTVERVAPRVPVVEVTVRVDDGRVRGGDAARNLRGVRQCRPRSSKQRCMMNGRGGY